MATVDPHTTRASNTILTASMYNEDHEKHISNAQAVNAELAAKVSEAAFNAALSAHVDNTENPHDVTAVQADAVASDGTNLGTPHATARRVRGITISTNEPSGGNDGDLWAEVDA